MDGQLQLGEERRVSTRNGDVDRLLVAGEVAAMLRVTTAWVDAETRANRLPHVRLGRYCRYRASAIENWIAEERAMTRRSRG